MTLTLEQLRGFDAADPLAPFRDRFVLPDDLVYLCGNSLGPLPKETAERIETVVREQWGNGLVRAWTHHDWIDLPARVGGKIGRLVGARPGEVVVTDSTSVNLFKLLAAAIRLRPERSVIVAERDSFPTDLYMIQGLIDLLDRPLELRIVSREVLVAPAASGGFPIDDTVAVACLSHVSFRDGVLHGIEELTARGKDAGALVLWDLAHSAGAMPLRLAEWGVELAVGCGYKYLNGGPGAPSFLYVAEALQEELSQPLWGWLGHAEPFAFEERYRPAEGISKTLCGTPPILSLAALEVGCDLLLDTDLEVLGEKGRRLGDCLIQLVDERLRGSGVAVTSPRNGFLRGSQVSLQHPEAFAVTQALIEQGVVGDFRAPDRLRFGLSPLVLRYQDLWRVVGILGEILSGGLWRQERFGRRSKVT